MVEEPTSAPILDERMTTAELAGTKQVERDTAARGSEEPGPDGDRANMPLFPDTDAAEFRKQWDNIQASFVDEPRRAVEQADVLVANAMRRLAEVFAAERSDLEGQWDRGDKVSTEDLRLALQRYRSFFGRLLAV
jgi:hypothetical protein